MGRAISLERALLLFTANIVLIFHKQYKV